MVRRYLGQVVAEAEESDDSARRQEPFGECIYSSAGVDCILIDVLHLQIVWDPDKKRWINQDEGEVEGEAFKPPPKMSELNLPQQQSPPPMGMAPIPAMPTPHQQQPMHQGMPPIGGAGGSASFMGAPAPVPSPMPMMMNPGQVTGAMQTMQPAEDGSAVDGGGGAPRVPTNNLQSNQFKLQRNRSEWWEEQMKGGN